MSTPAYASMIEGQRLSDEFHQDPSAPVAPLGIQWRNLLVGIMGHEVSIIIGGHETGGCVRRYIAYAFMQTTILSEMA